MKTIEWRDDFNINVAELDRQHQRLADLVNDLHRAVTGGREAADVSGILSELVKHTRIHFETEEHLMREYDYPDYQEHKSEHDALLDQLETVFHKISAGKGPVFTSELDESSDWVMVHMLGFDKPLGDYLNRLDRF